MSDPFEREDEVDATSSEEEYETLLPEPTESQDALWETIDEAVSEEDLDREEGFIQLSDDTQRYLATPLVAANVRMIGKQFSLEPWQVRDTARVIKDLFIGRIHPEKLGEALMREVKISSDIAVELAHSLDLILKGEIKNQTRQQPATAPQFAPEVTHGNTTKVQDIRPEPSKTPSPSLREEKTSESSDQPFMIHEEKPLFSEERRESTSSFSFKRPFEVRRNPTPPSPAPKVNPGQNPPPPSRVVHYSNLRTILNIKDKPETTEI